MELYEWLVPPFCAMLLCATVGNLIILVTARWLKKGISINLYLCLSLAAVDAWAALLAAIHLLLNHKAPHWPICVRLVVSVCRLSAMLTSILHLLGIAVIQLIAITYPVQSKVFWSSCRSFSLCVHLWLVPIAFMTGWNLLIPDDGFVFAQRRCTVRYALEFPFHLTIFLLVLVPFLATVAVYVGILYRISRRKQTHAFQSSVYQRSLAQQRSLCPSPQTANENTPRRRLYRHLSFGGIIDERAINTAIIIVGSFAVSWLPAAFMFMLICDGGCILTTKESVDHAILLIISDIITHVLLFIKWFFNPFLYAMRIGEVRTAWNTMCLQMRNAPSTRGSRDNLRMGNPFIKLSPSMAHGRLNNIRNANNRLLGRSSSHDRVGTQIMSIVGRQLSPQAAKFAAKRSNTEGRLRLPQGLSEMKDFETLPATSTEVYRKVDVTKRSGADDHDGRSSLDCRYD